MGDVEETSMNDPEAVTKHCAELFARECYSPEVRLLLDMVQPGEVSVRDYVMEPDVVSTLLAYFQAGGEPALVVDSLSSSTYEGLSQFSNLLGCWLAELETPSEAVSSSDGFHASGASMPAERELVESKLDSCALVRNVFESTVNKLVAKVFSPESADKIFDVVDGGEGGLDWLPMLIAHKPWRSLIYELVETYPNCLMLNFAVKLISDAGFQHEISNVTTAAQQLDIFSRVFLSSVEQLLMQPVSGGGCENSTAYRKAFEELRKIACFSEQTHLYIQALLQAAADRSVNGAGKAAVTNIAQSLRMALAKQGREAEVAPISAALLQSDSDQIPSSVTQAMLTMLVKGALNPADIGQLYQAYFEPFPPPVELIREPYFISLLTDALFSNLTPRINIEHRSKYIFLLAYATSVGETLRNGIRVQSKTELDSTRERIDQLISILYSPDDLLLSLNDLLRLLKTPILAVGLLLHVRTLLLRDDYLGEPLPVHLALIDQITTQHANLHSRVFETLSQIYDRQSSRSEVAEIVMARQKAIVDRYCHLLFCGYVVPVVEHINLTYQKGKLDSSLLRYFILEVLEMIEPPYSPDFIKCFLPLMTDPGVLDQINRNPLGKAFIDVAVKINQQQSHQ